MNKFINPFHFVTISPWPLLRSLRVLIFISRFIYWIKFKLVEMIIFSLIILILILVQWWRDVIREGEFQGFHSILVIKILRYRFLLFIVSELFFFISFFWSYFHIILNPPFNCGNCWPPLGVIPFDPYGIPLINSFILITSGITVTVCHHLILLNKSGKLYLYLTVFLGLIFTVFQVIEYYYSSFSIADSVYGSLFFIITGFHGLHVIIGSLFLIVCLYRIEDNQFLPYHHVGFEAASWYWHFVDVVWLFLYVIVYWWSVYLNSIKNTFNFQLKNLIKLI